MEAKKAMWKYIRDSYLEQYGDELPAYLREFIASLEKIEGPHENPTAKEIEEEEYGPRILEDEESEDLGVDSDVALFKLMHVFGMPTIFMLYEAQFSLFGYMFEYKGCLFLVSDFRGGTFVDAYAYKRKVRDKTTIGIAMEFIYRMRKFLTKEIPLNYDDKVYYSGEGEFSYEERAEELEEEDLEG